MILAGIIELWNAAWPAGLTMLGLGAAFAIVLLIGGGLSSLQSAVISTGLPFTLVLLVMCYAIWKGLASEKR